jgi:predicted transcriptional regulator of viral defense system
MKQVVNLKKLENLSYFDTEALAQITGLKKQSLYVNIGRWIENGLILQLKNGLYVTQAYYQRVQDKGVYSEFISNILRFPSYLSLEYVLAKYQVLTESVFSFTSITTKTTRMYSNNLGQFSYRNISDRLFCGYSIEKRNGYQVAIATKSKALFDYLFLKLYRKKEITFEYIESLRLNLDEFTIQDIDEFNSYIELVDILKYKQLPYLLFPDNDK